MDTSNIQKTLRISFIITVQNTDTEELKACLASITSLSLSDQERELIVVDNGKLDLTSASVIELLDHCIYLRLPQCSRSEMRNKALEITSGNYIQFIESADRLLTSPYEHCLDIIRFQKSDVVVYQTTSEETAKFTLSHTGPLTGTAFLKSDSYPISVCSILFHKDILIGQRFDTHITQGEEAEFIPRLLLKAEYIYTTTAQAYHSKMALGQGSFANDTPQPGASQGDIERIIERLQTLATTLPGNEQQALNRRIAYMSLQHLINLAKKHGKTKVLDEAIASLKRKRLYPLPELPGEKRYNALRFVLDHKISRNLLTFFLHRHS